MNTWYGIRYAASPEGALRWRAPMPIAKAPGALPRADADGTINVGPMPGESKSLAVKCWGSFAEWDGGSRVSAGTEDCLHVSIIAPPNASNLPVYAMIHGGGYTLGEADWRLGFPGLKHTNGAFVYVALQYRLGVFGFLGAKDVIENGTANAGLLDQRLGLEFVREHIAKFGGDPAKVTIAGGSAGGGSVSYQLMLNGGTDKTPPFQAAIAGKCYAI
jgi:carboxylesterase type B